MHTQTMDLRTHGEGRVTWDKVREWHGLTYTTKCKTDSQWEAAAQHREISLVLCDHLEGWDREGGRETQEGGDMGIHVYVQLIDFVIKQKLTHTVKQLYSNKDVKKKFYKIIHNELSNIKRLYNIKYMTVFYNFLYPLSSDHSMFHKFYMKFKVLVFNKYKIKLQ